MYTTQEVVQSKFWIVLAHGAKVGTLRITDSGEYEFFDHRSNQITLLADLSGLIDLNTPVIRDHDVTSVSRNVQGYPSGFASPVPAEHPRLPVFKKSIAGKSMFAAGYYIIKFRDWLPSFAPKLSTLEAHEFQGPYFTEWEMNLELKKVKRNTAK
jgi:hypothetical protein